MPLRGIGRTVVTRMEERLAPTYERLAPTYEWSCISTGGSSIQTARGPGSAAERHAEEYHAVADGADNGETLITTVEVAAPAAALDRLPDGYPEVTRWPIFAKRNEDQDDDRFGQVGFEAGFYIVEVQEVAGGGNG